MGIDMESLIPTLKITQGRGRKMSTNSDNQNSGVMKLKLDNYVRRSPDRDAKKPPKMPISEKQKEWLAHKCFSKCRNAYIKRMTSSALLSDFEEIDDLKGEAYINMWNILNKFDISHYKSKIADKAFFEALEKIPPFHKTETIIEEHPILDKKGNPVVDETTHEPQIEEKEVEKIISFTEFERTMFQNIGQIIEQYQKGKIRDYKDVMAQERENINQLKEKAQKLKNRGKAVNFEIPKIPRLTQKDCPLMQKLGQWIKDEKELKKSYRIITSKLKEGFYDEEGKNKPKTLEFYFTIYYYGRVNFTACEARAMKKDRGTGPVDAMGDEVPYDPAAMTSNFMVDPNYEITANIKYELDQEDERFRRFFTELYFLKSYQKEMREDYEDFKILKQRCDVFIQKIRKKYKIDYSGAK